MNRAQYEETVVAMTTPVAHDMCMAVMRMEQNVAYVLWRTCCGIYIRGICIRGICIRGICIRGICVVAFVLWNLFGEFVLCVGNCIYAYMHVVGFVCVYFSVWGLCVCALLVCVLI